MGRPRGGLVVVWSLLGVAAPCAGARNATFRPKALAAAGAGPAVYVYNEKEMRLWKSGATIKRFKALTVDWTFGPVCHDGAVPGERDTNQFDMPHIVLYRLLHAAPGARCRRARRPEDADLFLVPTWPFVRGNGASWNTACAHRRNERLETELPYLNEATAHRHLFLVGKGHLTPHDRCDAWWRSPTGLLKKAMRFAYSAGFRADRVPGYEHHHAFYGPYQFDDDAAATRSLAPEAVDDDEADYPHLVSVPYPSALHASKATLAAAPPPWAVDNHRHRDVLAIYVGTPHGGRPDSYSAVRPRLAAECAAAPDADCVVRDPYDHTGDLKGTRHFCGIARDAFPATFCLEPGGDSPYRKGFYDALLAGCVPVVWSKYFAHASPWFVPPNAVVVLNETAYVRGEFSVLDTLRAIPPATVHRMQHAIADGARRVQYALDDVDGDAVDTLLTGALDSARRRAPR